MNVSFVFGDLMVCFALSQVLAQDGLVVDAIDPREVDLRGALLRHKPAVVVIDPEMFGFDARVSARRALEVACPARVVAYCRSPEIRCVEGLVAAGVHGVLDRRVDDGAVLVAAIRVVAGGSAYVSPGLRDALVDRMWSAPSRAQESNLTARELEIMRCVASDMRDHEIAERLVISKATVAKHVAHALIKLRVATRPAAVKSLCRLGLLDDIAEIASLPVGWGSGNTHSGMGVLHQ